MPQPATAEPENPRRRAPEYSSAAGTRTSTDAAPAIAPATEARAGVTGHHVRTVLAVSIVAVILAFALVYAMFFG